MKATFSSGKLTASFESDTQKDLFSQLASFQEVFGQTTCGKCGSDNVRLFGVNKKGGGLFPKRKDGEGNWLPDGGWVKWNSQTKTVE